MHMYRCVYSDNNKGPIRCMGCNNYIYSKVGQGFMAISKQTLSILRLCLQTQSVYCLLPLIPCMCYDYESVPVRHGT